MKELKGKRMVSATCNVIGYVTISPKEELAEAVAAAQAAFPEWRKTPPLVRARCLFRLKKLMEERLLLEFYFEHQNDESLDDG